jgi:hypothetical protein
MGSQQQQPLQSVHIADVTFVWHTAAHAPPLELVDAPELLVEPDDPPELLDVDDPPELLEPEDPLEPPSSEPPPPLLLLHAASPTVVDAPVTTRTWKSFEMSMAVKP